MAVEIPLTRGLVTLVDEADAEWLSQWKWYAQTSNGGRFYACRGERRGARKRIVRMHRSLLVVEAGAEVDHINGNRLDNRRCNLRIATRSQNAQNASHKRWVNNLPKGVHQKGDKFYVLIMANGVRHRFGMFETAEEARGVYADAAIKLHGAFARLA